jgi:hypothetical protein
MSEKYNEIMPETDDRTLCIRITKPISPEGLQGNFIPRLDSMLDTHSEIRLLIHYADYKGWEEAATREDGVIILKYGPKIRKIAYVSPPKKEMFKLKINRALIAGEMEFFDNDDLRQALKWVKE